MSATVESTIVRLHGSGFPPARIAELVHVSPSTVRRHLPKDAGHACPVDLSFLPTTAMRVLARKIIQARAGWRPKGCGRSVEYNDEEVRLLRLCASADFTIQQIVAALSRLGIERTRDSVSHACKRFCIQLRRRGPKSKKELSQ